MEETPKEAKPEPVQTMVSEHVRRLVAAHNLAGKATGYTLGNKETLAKILIDTKSDDSPVLLDFIKKAEKAFIKVNHEKIIGLAEDMLFAELDKIRGCLG